MPRKHTMLKRNRNFYLRTNREIVQVLNYVKENAGTRESKTTVKTNYDQGSSNEFINVASQSDISDECMGDPIINLSSEESDLDTVMSSNETIHNLETVPNQILNSDTTFFIKPRNSTGFNKLRDWAVSYSVPHSSLRALLDILRSFSSEESNNLSQLPHDPRTFLYTPKCTIMRNVTPGHYCHVGIEQGLENHYKKFNMKPTARDCIEIGINIDGLPLSKSSASQVYPILGINNKCSLNSPVFLIGIYHGYEKPHDFNNFLSEFVDEANNLIQNGVVVFGQSYAFKISMFLFDAVAKASILKIKGHSGYSSCTKCTQEGEYISDRVCFTDLNFIKRTHDNFSKQDDSDHHTGTTILSEIKNINLITDIPLDYMHLIALGVVKKIVCGIWCNGRPPHKLSSRQIENISAKLVEMSGYIPSEFSRQPRTLKESKRWKATEYRQFLIYTGPVVLKDIIEKQKYQNFLMLSVSIHLLLSLTDSNNVDVIDYAEALLRKFVETVQRLYGKQIMSHNFHNLLHLADDCRKFGSLENFSNFSSENFLQSLLKQVRKHDKPLQQIIRRNYELNTNKIQFTPQNRNKEIPFQFCLEREYVGGVLIDDTTGPEFKKICFEKFALSLSLKDSCCILKDKSIIEIKNIVYCPRLHQNVVIGSEYQSKSDFFNIPCNSSNLDIFLVENLSTLKYWPISDIALKCCRMPYNNKFVVAPLLH